MQVVAVTDPATLGFAVQALVGIEVTGDVREVADVARRSWTRRSTWSSPPVATTSSPRSCASTWRHLLELVNDRIRVLDGVQGTEIFSYLHLVKQTYSWGAR